MNFKEYKYKINGTKFSVKVGDLTDNKVHVEVNGVPYDVELDKVPSGKTTVAQPSKSPQKAPRTESGEKVIAKPSVATGKAFTVTAPLPGTLMSYNVKVGDTVNAGDTVCVLEAMKMENDIHATQGGVVKQLLANVGDAIAQDGPIMILE
ncbi:MAG: biotin/lipoyl-binding protein [Bacteroides sp.]|nr:biotin/lipoyl-binding protein [Bacteroides sp.]